MRRRRRRRKIATKKLLLWSAIIIGFIGVCFLISKLTGSDNELNNYYNHFPHPESAYVEHKYSPASSEFSVWAPKAEEVRLMLYSDGEKGHADEMIKMSFDDETGLWSTSVQGNLDGKFYAFNAKYDEIWRGDTPGVFAKAVGVNGTRAAIIDFKDTNPADWDKDLIGGRSNLDDAIFYALHIRSFTIGLNNTTKDTLKGKYEGLSADNYITQSEKTTPIAFSHIKKMGVTHVRLMPIMDFIHVDEKRADIANSYSDGYSTFNYGVPEGSYSTNPMNPKSRIRELKEAIKGLHNSGIGVVLDVPLAINYQPSQTHFERLVPGYFFYGTGDKRLLFQEERGNYPLALQRPFFKNLIIDALSWWIEEYHIDGFNLTNPSSMDKDSFIDIVIKLKEKYPKLIVLVNDCEHEDWVKSGRGILTNSAFYTTLTEQDSLSISSFLSGKAINNEYWKLGVKATDQDLDLNKTVTSDVKVINRLTSYRGDDLPLSHLLEHANTKAEGLRLGKLAFTMLLTSQGIPEINAGDEFLVKKDLSNGAIDEARKIDWSQLLQNAEFSDYVSKLISLRKAHPAFRMKSKDIESHLEFIETSNAATLAYRLKENANNDKWEDIVVVYNTSKYPVKVDIPEGRYIVICRDGIVHEAGLNYVYNAVSVAPQSATVLYRSEKDVIAPPVVKKEPTEEKKIMIKELLPKLDLNINLLPATKEKTEVVEELNKIKIDN